jgi:hypothetical protein
MSQEDVLGLMLSTKDILKLRALEHVLSYGMMFKPDIVGKILDVDIKESHPEEFDLSTDEGRAAARLHFKELSGGHP